MISIPAFVKLALSFPLSEESPHFHLRSFRVGKRIFATLWEEENKAMLKLTPIDQSVFCAYDSIVFYPVSGEWGKKGATFVNLAKVRKDMLMDAMKLAYDGLSTKKKKPETNRRNSKAR